MYKDIRIKDQEVDAIVAEELRRQDRFVQLIASENFTSVDVLTATGSVLTNKYAEGYPGNRYYEGCEQADAIEELAIERAKQLFKVKYANVQPFSGTIANLAIYHALLRPGDRILGLDLKCGGHLSHGYKVSASGRLYEGFTYTVNSEGLLDYNEIMRVAEEVKPKMIVCGYSAYSRIFHFTKFREIADAVGAYLLADISHISGLVAANLHPSPAGIADVIMTTTHKTLRGPRGAIIMCDDPAIAKRIDAAVFPGLQGGASFSTIAAKAVAFGEALRPEFNSYQHQVVKNSRVFCDEFKFLGAKIVSQTTENHLFIIDTKASYGLTGQEAARICREINVIVNKNVIPFDKESPAVASGIRLGTPAMTTRGFKERDFVTLARIMHEAFINPDDLELQASLRTRVANLLSLYPLLGVSD